MLNDGSAAMWEAYCSSGGVRIKTTIAKVIKLFLERPAINEVFLGQVSYLPRGYWNDKSISGPLINDLFIKNVSYRYEKEFRFILNPDHNGNEKIFCKIADLYDFVDEVLVSPAKRPNDWRIRMIYDYGVKISESQERGWEFNSKNGTRYCRISNLYEYVNDEL